MVDEFTRIYRRMRVTDKEIWIIKSIDSRPSHRPLLILEYNGFFNKTLAAYKPNTPIPSLYIPINTGHFEVKDRIELNKISIFDPKLVNYNCIVNKIYLH